MGRVKIGRIRSHPSHPQGVTSRRCNLLPNYFGHCNINSHVTLTNRRFYWHASRTTQPLGHLHRHQKQSWLEWCCIVSFELLFAQKATIANTLWAKRTAFTRSAITPRKVNRFGWNLEHCEPDIGGYSWKTLGAIWAVTTVWEAAEIVFFCEAINAWFHWFPVWKILRHLHTTTSIGDAM